MRIDGTVAASSVEAQIGGAFPGQGERVPIQAEIDLHSAAPPWMNGALLPEAKRILDTQEEGDLMGHPWRFEQLCRSSGSIRIGDEEHRIEGGGNRIRRQGIRKVAQLWGHAWQAATFPSGRGFAYITYPPRKDGKPTLNEGHVFLGDGELVPARVVDPPWLQSLAPSGQDVSFGLETEQGTFEVRGETVLSTFMVMPPEILGGLELQQAIVRYTWDGETAPGMLERSIASRGASVGAEDDGQRRQAPQHEAVAVGPRQLVPRSGEAEVGEATEQAAEGHVGLEPGERGAEAVVRPVAEGQVSAGGSGHVQAVGVLDQRGVAVGGAEADQHLLAGGHHGAVEVDRRGRDPERGVGYGGREPQELLDGAREQARGPGAADRAGRGGRAGRPRSCRSGCSWCRGRPP